MSAYACVCRCVCVRRLWQLSTLFLFRFISQNIQTILLLHLIEQQFCFIIIYIDLPLNCVSVANYCNSHTFQTCNMHTNGFFFLLQLYKFHLENIPMCVCESRQSTAKAYYSVYRLAATVKPCMCWRLEDEKKTTQNMPKWTVASLERRNVSSLSQRAHDILPSAIFLGVTIMEIHGITLSSVCMSMSWENLETILLPAGNRFASYVYSLKKNDSCHNRICAIVYEHLFCLCQTCA